MFGGRLHAGVC